MKSGLSLVELATKIERQQSTKKDLVASTEHMQVAVEDSKVKLKVGNGDGYSFDVNEVAHQQLAQHTNVPAAYYKKMQQEAPELLAHNVNTWLKKTPAKRMVRTMDGTARAFLSDRYRPLENSDLAEAVLPVLLELGVEVMSAQITDTRLYIKAIDKSVVRDIPAGHHIGDGTHTIVKARQLSPSITISNSEVGMGALSIQGGVFDGFCTNLAVFGERSMRKYHVGGKHEIAGEELYALLSESTRRITDAAVWAQVRDVVKGAFEVAKFDALVGKIQGTQQEKIEGDVVKVLDFSAKKFGINEGEKASVLRHLIEGGDLSRFGLYNAITRTAEDLPDYDRASEFERLGGKVIELPANDWKELAKAA